VGKSVPYDIIPAAIGSFLAKDPDVGITVVEGWSPDLFRQLGEGDLDFVVSAPLPQVGVDLALKQEPLCQQVECPVVGVRHPLARLEKPSLRDLSEHLWLAPPRGNDGRIRFLQRIFQDAGVDPPVRFLFSDSTQIGTMMLKRGELICHGILEIVDQYLRVDEYVVLPFPELQFQRVVSLTYRRRSPLHYHALALCEAIRAVTVDRTLRTPNRSRIAVMRAPA
jgi:DNA-binding transcriptional LysR family regulator